MVSRHTLDNMQKMRAGRVSPVLAAAAFACVAAGVVTTASAAAAADAAAAGTPLLLHRKLLNHNSDSFRTLEEGGAHNALKEGVDVADQVSATTCLPTDDFVRTSGGKFTLGGRETVRERARARPRVPVHSTHV